MNRSEGPASHPVLSCSQSADWESKLLKSNSDSWVAMQAVGQQLGRGILASFAMTGFPQKGLSLLGLIGKGHNGGDALLAIGELLKMEGKLSRVTLVLTAPVAEMKPNTKGAFDLLDDFAGLEVLFLSSESVLNSLAENRYDICVDGLLGMQFRPPLRDGVSELIECVNRSVNIGLRVSVDLPSGVGDESDESPFRADVTFATGIYKAPLLACDAAGQIRYLDIGFFEDDLETESRVVVDRVLDPLRVLRPANCEKRQQGHLAIVAGSRGMPGALAMCVQAALKSGVGLVTVFAPESVVAQLACTLPEAMWRTWPETPEGGLALEGVWQIKSILDKATALLLGPGMGVDRETQTLLCEIGRLWDKPTVLDADALRSNVVEAFLKAGNSELVLTPHDGEFFRLSGAQDTSDEAVLDYAKRNELCLVKKGAQTRISNGEQLCVNTTGNPVLSRGGSGDLLAGLMAGLLAQGDASSVEVACRAVYWHGKAADLLAVAKGQTAVRTTDLLDFLSPALRGEEC